MTARLLHEPADESGRPSSLGIDAPATESQTRPALSVSPEVAAREAQRRAARAPERRAFLTPRVLDQGSFDELASSLAGLIDEAEASSGRLAARLEDVRQVEQRTNEASAQLQERLRLGARMLKAFQAQITRVEAAVAEFDRRREHLDQMEERLEAALGTLEARTGEVLGRAREELEQAAADGVQHLRAELEPLQQQVESIQERVQETGTCARDLEQRVESSQVEMAALAARVGEAGTEVEQSLVAAADAVGRCEQACRQGEGVIDELGDTVERAASAGQGLDERLALATDARQDLETLHATCTRLDDMLQRLEPWRGLLLGETRDGLPEPVARLVKELRVGVTCDLARLATTMRSVADRVDELTDGGRGGARPELRIARQSSMMPDIITVVEGSGSTLGVSKAGSSAAEGGQAV